MLSVADGGATPDLRQLGYSLCANRDLIGCNWLCENDRADSLCLSCLHTTKIPNISNDEKRRLWGRLERAKCRLFYALVKFNLPLTTHFDDSEGSLRFEFLGDDFHPDGKPKRVMTGHDDGLITINIAEADDAIREKTGNRWASHIGRLSGIFGMKLDTITGTSWSTRTM